MRILLCVAKSYQTFFLQQPVESLYTGTILEKLGHQVALLDLRLDRPMPEEIASFRPDLVFVVTSAYDFSQCYSLKLDTVVQAVDVLRKSFPSAPLIATGVHASVDGAATSASLDVDAVLPGELEAAIPWFVSLYEREGEALLRTLNVDEAPRQVDPADLPVPDYSLADTDCYHGEYVDPRTGALGSAKTGLIFANRGCPYSCSYCFVWFGSKMRYRPPVLVVEELRAQVRRGVTNFFFLDYTFTVDSRWVHRLCEELVAANLGITWICQTRCDRVSADLLEAMRRAGCTGIYYGVEAPWISEAGMDKRISRPQIEEAIRATNRAGIRPLLFILLGLETGRPQRADELAGWLAGIPAVFLLNVVLPRPGTGLWERHQGPTAGQTWSDLEAFSLKTVERHYLGPETTELISSLQQLPNYILNASHVDKRAAKAG